MMIVSHLHQISDSSDSSVTVKKHNYHPLKTSSHKALGYHGDSSDSIPNFLGLKRKKSICIYNI
jgi:hypothetical protein